MWNFTQGLFILLSRRYKPYDIFKEKFMQLLRAISLTGVSLLLLTGCASAEPTTEPITLDSESEVNKDITTPDEPLEGPEVVEAEPDRNSADGMFVSMMLPHHYQGLEMNILASRNTSNSEILDLVDQMNAAHEGEVAFLDELFWDWNLPYYQPEEGADMNMDSMSYEPKESSGNTVRLVHGGDGVEHDGFDYLVDENIIYQEGYEASGVAIMPGMLSDTEMIALFNARDAEFDKLWLEGMIMHHEGAIKMAKEHQENGIYPTLLELTEQIISQQETEIETMTDLLAQISE